MITSLSLDAVLSGTSIQFLFLVFARVSTVIFLLPGLGERYVANRYKISISIVLAISISFSLHGSLPVIINNLAAWVVAILSEIVIGFMIGLSVRIGILALQVSGAIIAQSSSIAQIFGGSVSNESQSTISNILTISGIALLLMNGVLEKFIVLLVNSYIYFDFNQILNRNDIIISVIKSVTDGFRLAFQLALPFLALSLFYNMTLGVINRAMPQLLVSFVGAPAIIAASLVLLIIATESILTTWEGSTLNSIYYLVR